MFSSAPSTKNPWAIARPGVGSSVESACKPGSVRLAARQSFLSARRRHLAPATYPGTTRAALSSPYLVLLRVGFTVPHGVGPVRGALLPHPFTLTCALAGHRRSALCCTGRRLTPPRSYLALCPAEPGLSSTHIKMRRDCPANSVDEYRAVEIETWEWPQQLQCPARPPVHSAP